MAHPNKDEGVKGHNAKLRRLTQDYGAANPSMNKLAKVDRIGKGGPQESVGFGVDADAARPRGDRPARKSSAANPIATYKCGGRVRESAKARARAEGGGVIGGAVPMRAMGGRLEGEVGAPGNPLPNAGNGRNRKGTTTNVNIIVAPQSPPPPAPPMAGAPALPPPPEPGPGAGLRGPGGPGAGAGPLAVGPGGMPPLPGMVPPGALPPGLPQLPRKRGGRVHPDAAEDAAQIRAMVKPSALKRARGGGVALTGGSESGPGRLEKSAARSRRQRGDKSAEV